MVQSDCVFFLSTAHLFWYADGNHDCRVLQGPRTPIMHIEPRRLGIKKAYQKPSQSATGSGIKRVVKPKSSGGAADDFEIAPSLTTLAPAKPKTAPKEQSQVVTLRSAILLNIVRGLVVVLVRRIIGNTSCRLR